MPQVSRGQDPSQLMAYLVGEGNRNEHEHPHAVAGSPSLMAWYSTGELDHGDALEIGGELNQPHRVFDVQVSGGHVWHCSLSLPVHDGVLSDEQWERVAEEFVHRMGFVGVEGKEDPPWVAVRHGLSGTSGNDHVHVVVSLVRGDGTRADVWKDYQRAQDTCRELEKATGLTRVLGDYSPQVLKRGELEAAQRRGRTEPDRKTLERVVRACSTASLSEDEFVRRLRGEGVLVRASFGKDEQPRGYSVALPPVGDEAPVYYAGSSVARDLGLGVLRSRWDGNGDAALVTAEWRAATHGVRVVAPGREQQDPDFDEGRMAGVLKDWRTRIESLDPDDKEGWRSAAADLSGVFAHWSRATEPTPGPLAEVSSELSRTAQLSRREYRPQAPDGGMSAASSVMLTWMVTRNDHTAALAVFRRLSSLAAAVRNQHEAQGDVVRQRGLETVARERLIGLNEVLHERAGVPVAAQHAQAAPRGASVLPPQYQKTNTKHGQMTR